MDAALVEWISMIVRWLHVVAGRLDRQFVPLQRPRSGSGRACRKRSRA